jgi:predicted SpoU family rRNA methylase
MPLPNMMLGYVGEKGNDVQTVLDCLIRGVKSDYRGLRENIYFVMNDDVRSRCREWQFYPVVNELQQRGITANVVTNLPTAEQNLMGIMMGAEKVDTSVFSFAPGAVADHLTSWSAEFQRPQTKMTDWIKAGATGSAGAVVEPYSNHAKFPTARFYLHYASGCTMLESFYYSIACPMQMLLLGDPLARPYAVPLSASIKGADVISDDFGFTVMVSSPLNDASYEYAYLLDGKLISDFSDDATVYLHPKRLADGYHELQTVVSMKNTTRFHNVAGKAVTVDRLGRSVMIRPEIREIEEHKYGIKAVIGGDEIPEKLRLLSGALILDEVAYNADAELMLDELMLGEGPNRIRMIAVYKDGMEVSGVPVIINITFNSHSPAD